MGGIQSLLPLLSSDKEAVQEAACLCIGNLARVPSVRESVVQSDAITPILQLLTSRGNTIQARAVWSLSVLSLANIGTVVQNQPQGFAALIEQLQTQNETVKQQVPKSKSIITVCLGHFYTHESVWI